MKDKTIVAFRSGPGRPAPLAAVLAAVLLGALAPLGPSGLSSVPVATAADQDSPIQRIERGHIVRVDVAGRQDISGRYTVDSNGAVTLPLIGAVNAAGRTTEELAADLSRRFSLVDRDIFRVTVSLAEYRSGKIFILGGVNRPGSYTFTEMPTVWDAIAEAGGATDDANLSSVEIIPGEGATGRSVRTVDVAAALASGRVDTLERLRQGDTVRIPRGPGGGGDASGNVYVFGAVGAQGPQPLSLAPDLVAAVIRAGGPAPDADLEAVEIVRRSGNDVVQLKVDMRGYLNRGEAAGNPALLAGDTIYMPRSSSGRTPRILTIIGYIAPVAALATAVAALLR